MDQYSDELYLFCLVLDSSGWKHLGRLFIPETSVKVTNVNLFIHPLCRRLLRMIQVRVNNGFGMVV